MSDAISIGMASGALDAPATGSVLGNSSANGSTGMIVSSISGSSMASNAARTAGSCVVGSGTAITPTGVARSRTSVIATASRSGWSSHSGNALGMANGAAAARGWAEAGA
jgi:hypothetical protein